MPSSKQPSIKKSMIVAGVMSGTSADGIDVALVRITASDNKPKIRLLAHEGYTFPASLRKEILKAMSDEPSTTPSLARLNWRLGVAYAEAIEETVRKHEVKLDLIGCHGQTVYHQPQSLTFAGKRFACTWQLGEPSLIAAQLQVPVASNFRPADMAAGGQGAPLVPLLDYVVFQHAKRGRVLQNIGGIANLTAIPPNSDASSVLAFDNGPGNMIIDALTQKLYNKPFDRNGAIAARGTVLTSVLTKACRHPFFSIHPPRTTGREQFGVQYAEEFLALCQKQSKRSEDTIATATAFTAETIANSFSEYVLPIMKMDESTARKSAIDYILSGGGARNQTLVSMLRKRLEPLRCKLSVSEDFGIPAQAKEAVAFALLAWQTWNHLPGNAPSATGAKRPAILGQVNYV